MKQRMRLIGISCIALLLAMITFATAALADVPATTLNSLFDYGASEGTRTETVSADEVLEALLGEPISDAERDYLKTMSGISLRYNDAIPDSNISTEYHKDTGTLEVRAIPYRYTANNGAVVEWIPTEAEINGTRVPLTSAQGHYEGRFEGLLSTGDFHMEVFYEWRVEFPIEAVEGLLNLSYTAGNDALREILAYEVSLAEYNAQMGAYTAYQEYLSAKTSYEEYLKAKRQYDADVVKYLEYVARYEQYAKEKEHYDAWKAYWDYENFRENRLEDFQRYVQYQNQVAKITEKLQVLESLFITDSNGWQLYRSLMGNMVTMVLDKKNQDDLVTAGCNRKDVTSAGEAAVALRNLMRPYYELREATYSSEHEKITALYAYYSAHYTELKHYFSQLCTSLNSLCDCSVLITKLAEEGKLLHYRQFVGQLYVTATCLDDAVKRDPNWTVNGVLLHQAVEACNLVPDTIVSDPSKAAMPEVEVPAVEEIPPASRPDGDPPRSEPKLPTPAVPEPVLPPTVTDPDLGVIPPFAEEPQNEPIPPTLDERLRALAEEIRAGDLGVRDADDAGNEYCITTSVDRLVSIDNRKLISFYAWDGKTLLSQQLVEYGTSFSADGIDTFRAADAQYTYQFAGWRLPDGGACSFVADRDLTLIASYKTTIRTYTVTWILNGVEKSYKTTYGEPAIDPFYADQLPPIEKGYQYVFSGWSPAVGTVVGDATYRATLVKEPIRYTVTWDLGDRIETTQVPYMTVPSYPGTPTRQPDSKTYTFFGWSSTPVPVTGDVTYTAWYTEKPLAISANGTVYMVTHEEERLTVNCTERYVDVREAAKYAFQIGKDLVLRWDSFSLTVLHENLSGLLPSPSGCIRLGIATQTVGQHGISELNFSCFNAMGEMALPTPMRLETFFSDERYPSEVHVFENGIWQKLEPDGREMSGSFLLRVFPIREIDVVATGDCNLSKIPLTALAGTLIDLRVDCSFGYEIASAPVKKSDGTLVPVTDLKFYMPADDVSVMLTVSQKVYEVIFLADGKELSRAQYLLGQQIVFPGTPEKATDDAYDYSFLEWSKDLAIAMGDEKTIVIEAVFVATPKIEGNPYLSGNNNNFTLTVLAPVGGVLLVGGIVAVILLRRRNAKRMPPANR